MSRERPTKLPSGAPAPHSISRPGINRFSADSKTGRQIAARTARIERGPGLTAEQQEWNTRVEPERLAKLARRKAKASCS